MVRSKYLTSEQDWNERIRVLESDLVNDHYDFLYFKIVLNMIDAGDNADYDREKIFKQMLTAYNRGAFNSIANLIKKLKGLE